MSVLSPSLRLKVLNHEFYECVWLQECFTWNQDVVDFILECLTLEPQFPGSKPIIQNQPNSKIYFLGKGQVDAFRSFDGVS